MVHGDSGGGKSHGIDPSLQNLDRFAWFLSVPLPEVNLRIKYHTFPVKPGQKAVVRCQPEQEIFNRFLKVKFWEIFRNDNIIDTVTHSSERFSGSLYPPLTSLLIFLSGPLCFCLLSTHFLIFHFPVCTRTLLLLLPHFFLECNFDFYSCFQWVDIRS